MNVDFRKLKGILKQPDSKTNPVKESAELLCEFNSLVSSELVDISNFTKENGAFFTMSMSNWFIRRNNTDYIEKILVNGVKQTVTNNIKVGDIYFADLGIKYKPEMGYTHPVIVIGIVGNYILVVPTTTTLEVVSKAYHPIDNITGKKYFRKVTIQDGFASTCAVALRNVETISRGRIIERKGCITTSGLLDEIQMSCFSYIFPRCFKEYQKMKNEIIQLTADRDTVKTEKELLEKEKATLERQINELKGIDK